jgi:hypothetical protein
VRPVDYGRRQSRARGRTALIQVDTELDAIGAGALRCQSGFKGFDCRFDQYQLTLNA